MPKKSRGTMFLAFVGILAASQPPRRLEIFWGYIRIARAFNFFGITLLVILSTLVANSNGFPVIDAIFGAIGVSLGASAGSVMNDIYDFPTNRITRGRENRAIVRGLISIRNAWIYYGVLSGLSLLLFAFINWSALFVGIACTSALAAYSWKARQVNGLLSNIIVAGVMGIASGFGGLIINNIEETLFLLFLGFLIAFARELVLDIWDIETDRRGNLKTLPITIGIENTYAMAVGTIVLLVAYSYLPTMLGIYGHHYAFLMTLVNIFSLVIAFTMIQGKNRELQRTGLKLTMFIYPLVVTVSELFL